MAKKRKPDRNRKKNPQTPNDMYGRTANLESLARKAFKEQVQNQKERRIKQPVVYAGLDYDTMRQKRRISAIRSTVQKVKENVSGICAGFDEKEIENEWVEINTYPVPAYDYEELYTFSVVGAVIWMLDQIKEADRLRELYDLVTPGHEIMIGFVPPIHDLCHSYDVILSMTEMCYLRNALGDYPTSEDAFYRRYMSSAITNGTVDREGENRMRFDSILSLIPQTQINLATQNYTDKFWDWVCRYYRTWAVFRRKEEQLRAEMDAFNQHADSVIAELKAAKDSNFHKHTQVLSNPNPLPDLPDLQQIMQSDAGRIHTNTNFHQIIARSYHLDDEMKQVENKREELNSLIERFLHICGFIPQMKEDSVIEEFGEEIAEIWKGFDPGDPYEMCFAFMHLLDQGSDLPWCYFPGVNLHTAYCARLPWPRNRVELDPDGIWNHYDDETGVIVPGPKKVVLPKRIRVPELEDWTKLQYAHSNDDQELYSLSQIIYEITGCIMPRNLERYQPALQTLDQYGITGKRATHPLMYCMSLLGESQHQTRFFQSPFIYEPFVNPDSQNDEVASSDDMQSELEALRAEVKNLKQQVYDYSREARDERQRFENLAQKAANDAQELHDLRELVFNQQTAFEEDTVPVDEISFPYYTDKRIVVFGGHDSWTKEMKPKFPDIRFVDRDTIPNPDMIRRADVVWIQTNALAHKHFYRIIDEVRKHGIPLRYFAYSGIMKCAEQLIQNEKK